MAKDYRRSEKERAHEILPYRKKLRPTTNAGTPKRGECHQKDSNGSCKILAMKTFLKQSHAAFVGILEDRRRMPAQDYDHQLIPKKADVHMSENMHFRVTLTLAVHVKEPQLIRMRNWTQLLMWVCMFAQV